MILAAGLGTRLGALGRAVPKILLEIGGQPLLARHLRYLERQGVSRVVINTHHHAACVESFARSYDGPLEIVCIREPSLLGTAGGVRNALGQLEPGPFLVLYGDVLIDEPLDPVLRCHRTTGARATLAVHEADSGEGKGVVEVDRAGRVVGFVEKGAQVAGRVLINSGVYVLESDTVSPLAPGVPSDFGTDVFPSAVERGLPLFAARLSSPVIDIGTPEGLSLARARVGGSALELSVRT
jgi:NDP-sugar pyrophosphorylase family protein